MKTEIWDGLKLMTHLYNFDILNVHIVFGKDPLYSQLGKGLYSFSKYPIICFILTPLINNMYSAPGLCLLGVLLNKKCQEPGQIPV
jgi:hypothetical protein